MLNVVKPLKQLTVVKPFKPSDNQDDDDDESEVDPYEEEESMTGCCYAELTKIVVKQVIGCQTMKQWIGLKR